MPGGDGRAVGAVSLFGAGEAPCGAGGPRWALRTIGLLGRQRRSFTVTSRGAGACLEPLDRFVVRCISDFLARRLQLFLADNNRV